MSDLLLQGVSGSHYVGDGLLEQGVLADMSGKPQPKYFRQALEQFRKSSRAMDTLLKKMEELIGIHKSATVDRTFAQALERVLQGSKPLDRVSLSGVRYSNIGSIKIPTPAQPKDLLEMMTMQRDDLVILKRQLDEMIQAFTTVLPLADRGEFASALLSGRFGFADKVQQSVFLLGLYNQFYVAKCMATIDATMQVYPTGLQWLRQAQQQKD